MKREGLLSLAVSHRRKIYTQASKKRSGLPRVRQPRTALHIRSSMEISLCFVSGLAKPAQAVGSYRNWPTSRRKIMKIFDKI